MCLGFGLSLIAKVDVLGVSLKENSMTIRFLVALGILGLVVLTGIVAVGTFDRRAIETPVSPSTVREVGNEPREADNWQATLRVLVPTGVSGPLRVRTDSEEEVVPVTAGVGQWGRRVERDLKLVVSAPSCTSQEVILSRESRDHTVSLHAKPVLLSGVVTRDSVPWHAVRVTVASATEVYAVSTDSKGRFALEVPGTVTPRPLTIAVPGFELVARLAAGSQGHFTLAGQPGGVLRFRHHTADGEHAPCERVIARMSSGSRSLPIERLSDESLIRVPVGCVELQFDAGDYGLELLARGRFATHLDSGRRLPISLSSAVSVSGSLLGVDEGSPWSVHAIPLQFGSRKVQGAVSNGRYVLRGLQGGARYDCFAVGEIAAPTYLGEILTPERGHSELPDEAVEPTTLTSLTIRKGGYDLDCDGLKLVINVMYAFPDACVDFRRWVPIVCTAPRLSLPRGPMRLSWRISSQNGSLVGHGSTQYADSVPENLDVEVREVSSTIRGLVAASSPDVEVGSLEFEIVDGDGNVTASFRTDSLGRFEIERPLRAHRSHSRIRAVSANIGIISGGGWQVISPLANELRFIVGQGFTFQGKVVDDEGPVAGARVSSPGGFLDFTDALGRFFIFVSEARSGGFLEVSKKSYSDARITLEAHDQEVVIQLYRRPTIRLRFLEESGNPARGVAVAVRGLASSFFAEKTTGSDGELEFAVPETGEYELAIDGAGGATRERVRVQGAGISEDYTVAARVTVRVSVVVPGSPTAFQGQVVLRRGRKEFTAKCDTDGVAVFLDLVPDRYLVTTIDASDDRCQHRRPFVVSSVNRTSRVFHSPGVPR